MASSANVGSPPRPAPRGKPMSNEELANELCAVSPILRDARRVHVANFGALIPHVFMSDVLARVGACLLESGAPPHEAGTILASLERALAEGDRETRNVISISFARDGELEPFFARLWPLLGPRLRAQCTGK